MIGPKIILRKIYFALRRIAISSVAMIKEKNLKPIRVESILVIRIDRIGDLIVSLPTIKLLKESFSGIKLSVLVHKGNDALIAGLPWIDEIICYEGFIRTLKLLRKKRFDLAVDLLMDYPLKTALLARFSKAGFCVGFDIESRGRLFHLSAQSDIKKKQISKHLLDLAVTILKVFNKPADSTQELEPRLFLSAQAKNFALKFLEENGIRNHDILFVLHPGGKFPSQRLPLEKFTELAKRLSQEYKARIIIVAGLQEKKLVNRLLFLMKIEPLLAVGLPLDKLAAVISTANVFIGNNSGPLHIAAALGIPTVSTMGPTDPILWWPQGKGHIVIRHNLPCSPCNRGFCWRHNCMRLITVKEVIEAVEFQIERNKIYQDMGR